MILETVMAVLSLFPAIPERIVIILLCACCAAMLFSLTMYVIYLLGLIHAEQNPPDSADPTAEAEE